MLGYSFCCLHFSFSCSAAIGVHAYVSLTRDFASLHCIYVIIWDSHELFCVAFGGGDL